MLSPRLKFKVLLTCAFGFASERTRLTKFLSASNQIVKDLDCPPSPPEGRKDDQPASKLARFTSPFPEKPEKGALGYYIPKMNHKNFVLEKELTGGCYHRRAKRFEIRSRDGSHVRRYGLLPPCLSTAYYGRRGTPHC